MSSLPLWARVACGSILFLCIGVPALRCGQAETGRRAALLDAQLAGGRQTLNRLRGDAAALKDIGGRLSAAEIERLLAPANRFQVAANLQRLAASSRLRHFTYVITPERKVAVEGQNLALSEVTVSGDAALDTDVYDFIGNAGHALTGRAKLLHLSVGRLDSGAAGLSVLNLHFSASFEWLSNGAPQLVSAAP